jgi:tRNA-splicing ligase RtcB
MKTIFGNHDQKTLDQFDFVMKSAEHGALCADGHLGYVMPIGGVAAYKNKISPVGVGFDIGCGNCAIQLDTESKPVLDHLSEILDTIQSEISFGVGRKNKTPVDHDLFNDEAWNVPEIYKLKDMAWEQLGTVGSGNHYVDIFKDENDFIWIGVHFGSRGLGHKICTGFLNLSINGNWDERAKEQECLLDLTESLGQEYFAAMQLAGKYAYAGREWVCNKVNSILGNYEVLQTVHNNHNFAWTETHFDNNYVVIRKGATPAFPGQKGFIGGSMGDNAVIVEGLDSDKSKAAMYSTVHGAGRIMSRTKAAGKYKGWGRKRHQVSRGEISHDMLNKWLSEKNVVLKGGGLDEAPQAYRRLPEVLKYHEGTIKILHALTPLGVVMAGENEFDPYKD